MERPNLNRYTPWVVGSLQQLRWVERISPMAFRISKKSLFLFLIFPRMVAGQIPEHPVANNFQVTVPQDAVPVARFSEPQPDSLTLAPLFEMPTQEPVPAEQPLQVIPLQTQSEAQRPPAMNLNPLTGSQGSLDLVRQPIQVANSLSRVGTQDYFRLPAASPLPIRGISPDSGSSSDWNSLNYCWASPVVCYRPLYFEQVNLERYGIGCGPLMTPVASAAHFYGSLTMLPAKVICQPCHSCTCSLGHQRPGDCVPVQRRSGTAAAPTSHVVATDNFQPVNPQDLPLPLEAETVKSKSDASARPMAAAPAQIQTPTRLPYPKRLAAEPRNTVAVFPVASAAPATTSTPPIPATRTPPSDHRLKSAPLTLPNPNTMGDVESLPPITPSSVKLNLSDTTMR
jgi:hypothetical protein